MSQCLSLPRFSLPPLFNEVYLTPSTNAVLAPHPCLQTSYSPSAHFVSPPSAPPLFLRVLGCFCIPPASSFPLTLSGFFNGMPEVFEPLALNYHTLFRLIRRNLSVSRNLTLIRLPLNGSLNSLLCNLIALTPCLTFFLLMTCTLEAASSFSSGRDYFSLNFLPPLSLRLTPNLIM